MPDGILYKLNIPEKHTFLCFLTLNTPQTGQPDNKKM